MYHPLNLQRFRLTHGLLKSSRMQTLVAALDEPESVSTQVPVSPCMQVWRALLAAVESFGSRPRGVTALERVADGSSAAQGRALQPAAGRKRVRRQRRAHVKLRPACQTQRANAVFYQLCLWHLVREGKSSQAASHRAGSASGKTNKELKQ